MVAICCSGTRSSAQDRRAVRNYGHAHRRSVHGDNRFRANYNTRCARCATSIVKGDWVVFARGWSTVVHVSCRQVQQAVIQRDALRQRPVLLQDSTIPHGVSAQTVDTYAQVWDRYVAFARSRGFSSRIPGKHLPWDMELLWAFMQFRACTCKPATVISNISALAHFGWRAKFILPTSRTDGDPVGYREIRR